jgi:hypothetical protein
MSTNLKLLPKKRDVGFDAEEKRRSMRFWPEKDRPALLCWS